MIEPAGSGFGTGVGKGRVKHHLGHSHIDAIVAPIREITARVQVIGRTWAKTSSRVEVERQR